MDESKDRKDDDNRPAYEPPTAVRLTDLSAGAGVGDSVYARSTDY